LLLPTAIFGLQFLGLLAFGTFLWHRFTLGMDYAEYGQAFSSIGSGHLYPVCTICGYPYLQSHFELIMWPLSILYFVFRTIYVLVVVQAASVTVASATAYLWLAAWLRKAAIAGLPGTLIRWAAALVLVVSPLTYGTVAGDFHFEATATMFALLTAYAVWRGANRWAIGFAVGCLLCGDIGALYLAGVGLSALLAGRRSWRLGTALIVAGVVWIGAIGYLGANKGSVVGAYAYLAGRSRLPAGFAALTVLLGAVIRHPGKVLSVLSARFGYFARYLVTGGGAGIASAWGFGVPALLLLASGLQQSTLFIGQPFQQFAVTPFVTVGTAMIVGSLLDTGAGPSWLGRVFRATLTGRSLRVGLGCVTATVCLGAAVYESQNQMMSSAKANSVAGFIPAGEGATLRTLIARIPRDAEVIVSLPIAGRFGARRYVYLFEGPGTPIPIRSRTVVLVLDTSHTLQLASRAQDESAIEQVRRRDGARLMAATFDVTAAEWHPSAAQGSMVLP
jgi:hypothetical protein